MKEQTTSLYKLYIKLRCLNTCFLVCDGIWEGYGTFKSWRLPDRSASLRVGLKDFLAWPYFLFVLASKLLMQCDHLASCTILSFHNELHHSETISQKKTLTFSAALFRTFLSQQKEEKLLHKLVLRSEALR